MKQPLINNVALGARGKILSTRTHKTVQLGELVATVFDEAALHSSDSKEISHLAARAVMHLLRRARKKSFFQASSPQ